MARKIGNYVTSAGTSSNNSRDEFINGQDHLLPLANIGRIMKQVLPPNVKISKEAKETMQECASEFIGFITGEASHRCRNERRKTINGDNICHSMKTFGLDEYANATFRYLEKYREQGDQKATKSIQIDVIDELSIQKNPNCYNGNKPERGKRAL